MIDTRMSLLQEGFTLLRQAKPLAAWAIADALIIEHANDPECLFLGSQAKLALDEIDAGIALMAAASNAAGDEPQLMLQLARLQTSQRYRTDARSSLVRLSAIADAIEAGSQGNAAELLHAIGAEYARLDDPSTAVHFYQRALAAGCTTPALRYDFATALFFSGEFELAEHQLEAMLEIQPKAGHALYLRATLRRQTLERNHVDDLQARLASGFPNPATQAGCGYALAKEREDLGQDSASFAALSEAARLKRQTLQYDLTSELAAIEAIRTRYSDAVMQLPTDGHSEAGAIFIVGMPRSGTTLVERMLTRHSDVRAAGELLDFGHALAAATRKVVSAQPSLSMVDASLKIDFAALGRDYMRSAREAAPGSAMLVDKMPINYMYCGLIKKALPNAKIIHLVREPMDSCYAVYKTLFGQAYHFSYDQEELAAYFAAYYRQMQHWHRVMPNHILDVRYEDLVVDTEAQVSRILSWCGLTWDASVLSPAAHLRPSTTASAAQVREPVHVRSVGKWRNYEAGLAPLKARLIAEGVLAA